MKKPQILYNSSAIHARIKQILANPNPGDRRVAVVAYVGKHGESFLPHPAGLNVVCNPSAGATDPDVLRSLIKHGADVKISDALHMKVYWSRQRGCVMTSANASANALGVSGLKEAGIWLPPGALDIDRLLTYAQPRKLTAKDLRKLDEEARRFAKRQGGRYLVREKAQEFIEWFNSPHHSIWKINWCDEIVSGAAKAAKEEAMAEYGRKEPHVWTSVRKSGVNANDWLLSFSLANDKVTKVEWIYVDFLVKISPKDKTYYWRGRPYHAVQVYSPSRYPTPPFRISKQFRRALHEAVRRYSFERIMKVTTDIPSAKLLNFVADEMNQ